MEPNRFYSMLKIRPMLYTIRGVMPTSTHTLTYFLGVFAQQFAYPLFVVIYAYNIYMFCVINTAFLRP